MKRMNPIKLVERFLCPGCVSGPGPKSCGAYKPLNEYGHGCGGHVLGTYISGAGHIALGLPKGFCRPGPDDTLKDTRNKIDVRLWLTGTAPAWDQWNIPVWAKVEDGFLFVRTYAPRINRGWVDVIENGTLEMIPQAANVTDLEIY